MRLPHALYIFFVLSLLGFLYYYYTTDDIEQIQNYTYENGSLYYSTANDLGVKSYQLKLPNDIQLNPTDKLSIAYRAKRASVHQQPNDTIKLFINDKLVYGENDKMELFIKYKSHDDRAKYEYVYKS